MYFNGFMKTIPDRRKHSSDGNRLPKKRTAPSTGEDREGEEDSEGKDGLEDLSAFHLSKLVRINGGEVSITPRRSATHFICGQLSGVKLFQETERLRKGGRHAHVHIVRPGESFSRLLSFFLCSFPPLCEIGCGMSSWFCLTLCVCGLLSGWMDGWIQNGSTTVFVLVGGSQNGSIL